MSARFDNLRKRAEEAAKEAVEHVNANGVGASAKSGVRFILQVDPDRPVTIEDFIARTIQLVRNDDELRQLSDKDVLKASTKRRRRLGSLSIPGGPFAMHAVDLYCDVATVCDLAERHKLNLTDEQIAAHMLVLWNVIPDLAAAQSAMHREEVTLTQHLSAAAVSGAVESFPDQLTVRSTVNTIRKLREAVPDRLTPGRPRVRHTVLPRGRSKRFISDAEALLMETAQQVSSSELPA
ncbi:MAG: hypothetical protein ACPHCI_02055 [Solirubrobacterales bacterium]